MLQNRARMPKLMQLTPKITAIRSILALIVELTGKTGVKCCEIELGRRN